MKDKLTQDERQSLTGSKPVTEFMRNQWDSSDEINDPVLRSKIFDNIKKTIWGEGHLRRFIYYRLSLAASIAIIIGLSFSVYFYSTKQDVQHIFIASSGIQNMTSVVLADGSSVLLGPGSKLTYPESFASKKREVTLSGQAFFDVTENKNKPFVVHTSQMDVTVLGTAFELFSYDVENKTEAILLNGKIRVEVPGNTPDDTKQIFLLPNEKLTFDKQTRELSKEYVDADKYTAWRNRGILTFENEKLAMIIPRLEQWYGQKIICQTDIAEEYRFTFKIRDESLERILFILRKTSPIKYEKTEGGDFILNR